MKRLLYAFGMVTFISAALVSCNGNNKEASDNQVSQSVPILGTWRYASMTYFVSGDKPDTISTVFSPDTIQIYDVYRPDSILESYVILRDSILRQTQMRYIFRNDSILAENDEKKVEVHLAHVTDSTLNFDFTLAAGYQTAHCQTLSERCELPDWLKIKIEK